MLVAAYRTALTGASLLVFISISAVHAETGATGLRQRALKWPPKTARTLLTDAQIAHARRLCDTDPSAAAQRSRHVGRAAYWIKIPDEELRGLLPDSRVPRAFNVSTEGCPVHGKAIYSHGTYPWKLDRARPLTVICPVGGERYPSNDFEAYYRAGMKDESLLTGPHADPGRGWIAPNGKKYWLVGYACHWNWRHTWLPAISDLSRAYLLTGKRIYGRKAIVMLDRIADIYPGMDYSKQSRYAERMHGKYHGKILNAIWETRVYRELAIAYDYVFDALIGDNAVCLAWREAAKIRANIEAGLLEEGIEAIERHQIAGNFGMHQSALAYGVVVRQTGPTAKLLDSIFTHTGGSYQMEGLNYALYNLVFKDGMPYETSPGYCFSWVGNFVLMAKATSLAGINLYDQPKFPLMFDAPLQMVCVGAFTPAIGDAGSIDAGWVGPQAYAYEEAYRHYQQPRYAWALDHLGGLKHKKPQSFDDLFEEPITAEAQAAVRGYRHQPRSRVLDGYGLAVLNNRTDSVAATMYYGVRGGHGHYDRLNIELFAHGLRFTPDLGYPDFMNAFVPGIFSWSKNTISHNCLVVDQQRQHRNRPGTVLRLHDSPTVHVVDVDASGTYEQTGTYRRTLVLVDVGQDNAYLVDVFRVRGGRTHVLSMHGPEGTFELQGVSLPPPVSAGTLAGRHVPYGHLYDAPELSKPGYSGSFGSYRGSGYSHFYNWQRASPTRGVTGSWRLGGKAAGLLRLHLPLCPQQEVIVADAFVSPTRKVPTVLKYMLVRRTANETGNTFVAVWEPSSGTPLIGRVEMNDDPKLGVGSERTIALRIHRGAIVDRLVVAARPGRLVTTGPTVRTDAAVAAVSDCDGQRIRTFAAGGTTLSNGETAQPTTVPATISGVIEAVDYDRRDVVVTTLNSTSDAAALAGQVARVFNDHHSCVYSISAAEADGNKLLLKFTGSDVFTGRVKITSSDASTKTVFTATRVLYPANVKGMTLVTDDLSHAVPIVSMEAGHIQLADDPQLKQFLASLSNTRRDNAWIADFGAGDQIEIERFVHVISGPWDHNQVTEGQPMRTGLVSETR